jgi:uncharacterized protein YegL
MFETTSTQWKKIKGSPLVRSALLVFLIVGTAILANARDHHAPLPPEVQLPPNDVVIATDQPRIEAVFVLDTTGSMSGLIEGAKQKIWTVVNQMSNANTTPEIRIGLIGYRDRGDQYVTRRFDLTEDIDALYGNLQGFTADGGGDTPESVNQALHEAVTTMGWSRDQETYRVVFLVGDAPPHMDYQDDVPYMKTVEAASQRGIVINTIQCGSSGDTARVFASIAELGRGNFASISQDGAMVASHTPMDAKLAELNVALAETVVAYGEKTEKDELLGKVKRSLAAAPSAVASRLSYFAKRGGVTNSGRSDLVTALEREEVDLDELSGARLPAELQEMSATEREGYLREKIEERVELQTEIAKLAESRDAYLKGESRKRRSEGKADAFDDNILDTIRSQAAKKGIVY